VQVEQWTLGKVLAALVGCGRKCKTFSNETTTTTKSKAKQQKRVPPKALLLPSTKQRKYRLLNSYMDQHRSPKANNSLVICQMTLLYGT